MVFDPNGAPRSPSAFRQWYFAETKWAQGDDNFDPKFATKCLQDWYQGMIDHHPNLVLAEDDAEVGEHWADYTFGQHLIYVSMTPRHANEALERSDALASELNLGRYYPMDDDGRSDACIRFPDGLLEPDPPAQPRQGFFARLFGSKK